MSHSTDGSSQASPTSYTVEEPSYKRPGKRGVDYDEYGAEMDPNARVWGVYVDETDKADKELYEGWNGAMDVMLVFAAVFSAILTAFVIESSKDLKPDYSEISARALIIISKTPSFPGIVPSENGTDTLESYISEFVPTRSAVVVNTLWFLSLALSIAVTLISMLAKEWCYSFMTRRTGAKFTQGRLRQNRWNGIRYWKMQVMILMLPLLMYMALLLFAIGLSVYLWNINPGIALPVIITTALTALYYISTVILSFCVKYCPYTTAIVKLFHLLWKASLKSKYLRAIFRALVFAPPRFLLFILGSRNLDPSDDLRNPNSQTKTRLSEILDNILRKVDNLEARFYRWIEQMLIDLLDESKSVSVKNGMPMDKATSAMLLWMITNCEDPKSVDIALQALAGADSWLPCELLLRRGVDFQILRKLQHCLYMLESPHIKQYKFKAPWNEQLDNAYLYSRALATLIRGARETTKAPRVSKKEWNVCMGRMNKVLRDNMDPSGQLLVSPSSEYRFGNLLLEGSLAMSESNDNAFPTQQAERQWELLEEIIDNKVQGLPPSATSVRALACSPLTLVRLFNEYHSTPGNEDLALEHSIGVALTIARFADTRYSSVPGGDSLISLSPPKPPNGAGTSSSHIQRAAQVYSKLATEQPNEHRTRELLTFGLLGFLDRPNSDPYYQPEEITLIEKALQTLDNLSPESHELILVHQGQSLRHIRSYGLTSRTPSSIDPNAQFKAILDNWLEFRAGSKLEQEAAARHLRVLLSPSRCRLFGNLILDCLGKIIPSPNHEPSGNISPLSSTINQTEEPLAQPSLFLVQKLCIQSITLSITQRSEYNRQQERELKAYINWLDRTEFFGKMSTLSERTDKGLAPYGMRFLWRYYTATITAQESDKTSIFHAGESRTSVNQESVAEQGGITRPGHGIGALGQKVLDALGLKRDDNGCVRAFEFEQQWFSTLLNLCKESPQDVIDSGILNELTEECKDKCYLRQDRLPSQNDVESATKLLPPDSTDAIDTWLDIYKLLKKKCEDPKAGQPPAETKSSAEEEGAEEHGTTPSDDPTQHNTGGVSPEVQEAPAASPE